MASSELAIQLAYVVAAAMFIYGLKLLGSADSARRGNMMSAIAMLLAMCPPCLIKESWNISGYC